MSTRVFSEIGRLKKVMVHSPGREIDVIVPEGADDLLFEDILFGERAKNEHKMMCDVLRKYGVETYDIQELLVQSLQAAGDGVRNDLLDELGILEHLSYDLLKSLKSFSCQELGKALIEGILLENHLMDDDNFYRIRPIPNLMFARDPVIVAYDRVFSSSMAEPVRRREARLMTFIFSYHPDYKAKKSIINLREHSTEGSKLTLEGGDFLVFDRNTVAIAWSKRTSLKSIKMIAKELKEMGVNNLIVVELPSVTSFIHLDTVFTRISQDECLIYPPLFAKESNTRSRILYFDLTKKELKEKNYYYIFNLFHDLKIEMNPVYCGGRDSLINQKREQWTQGANAFCIAPGIILIYARNVNTIKELSDAGYLCVNASEVLSNTFTPNLNRKTAILLKGEELCRARGGPRCLTHPLLRD